MSTKSLYNEKVLLEQVVEGDEIAFREVYEHYRGKIFAYAWHLTKSKETAHEVVQSVFIKLWQKKDTIDVNNHFEGYIIRITQHHVLNLLRDAARDKQRRTQIYQYLEEIRNNPQEDLLAKELSRTYHEAIEQLPQQKKIIYRMREENGLNHAEIAEQLQISPHTVKKHMVEAVRFIRDYVRIHHDIGCLLVASYLYEKLG